MSRVRTLACALTMAVSIALQSGAHADETAAKKAANLPKELVVPAGNRRAFQYRATGVQIYTCQTDGTTAPAWVLKAPEAKVRDAHGKDAGTHSAGPTWEALDKSRVVGTKVAAASPDAMSIPWLLLQAASHEGKGVMAAVTYIQRLDTKG